MKAAPRSLLVLVLYHHNNTQKIAKAFATVLDAPIRAPQEIGPEELQQYDLIGSAQGSMMENTTETCWILPTGCRRLTERRHFFSRPVSTRGSRTDPFVSQEKIGIERIRHR